MIGDHQSSNIYHASAQDCVPVMTAPNRRPMLVLLLLSALIISLSMGLRQSLGLFLPPVTLDLGISAAAFSFSLALQNIVWGISQPFVGALADRYGARPVLVATALTYAAGLLLMVYSTGALGLDVAGFLTGVGVAGTGFGVLIGVVARAAPPERQSQTVGAVAAAGSLGTLLLAPVGQALIDSFGWRAALIVFAGVAFSMILFSLPIRDPAPARDAKTPVTPQGLGEALREAMGHRGYLAMTVAFFACGFQLIFITTHLPQYLLLCGVAPGAGARALALIGLFNTVGTYAFGLLGARYSQKRLLALIYLLRTLFIVAFVLLPVSAGSTLVFAAAMGLLWLGVAPLVTGIIARVFGLTHFNTLNGVVFLSHQVGSFCGAWMGGRVFDFTGSYDVGWAALVAVGAIAFLLQWTMDDRPPAVRRPAAGAVPATA
jgi:predicted MFS family arabinose efflux permease